MNYAELEQAKRELNSGVNEVVRYLNNRSDYFIVNIGAFEIRFELAKLGNPEEVKKITLGDGRKFAVVESKTKPVCIDCDLCHNCPFSSGECIDLIGRKMILKEVKE